MVRFVSALALALAIAFGGSIVAGSISDAAAKTAVCKKKTVTGKTKTWRCKRGQFCCSAPILGYFGCGTKTLGCFPLL